MKNEFHDRTFCHSARRGYETGQVAVDVFYNVCGKRQLAPSTA